MRVYSKYSNEVTGHMDDFLTGMVAQHKNVLIEWDRLRLEGLPRERRNGHVHKMLEGFGVTVTEFVEWPQVEALRSNLWQVRREGLGLFSTRNITKERWQANTSLLFTLLASLSRTTEVFNPAKFGTLQAYIFDEPPKVIGIEP